MYVVVMSRNNNTKTQKINKVRIIDCKIGFYFAIEIIIILRQRRSHTTSGNLFSAYDIPPLGRVHHYRPILAHMFLITTSKHTHTHTHATPFNKPGGPLGQKQDPHTYSWLSLNNKWYLLININQLTT